MKKQLIGISFLIFGAFGLYAQVPASAELTTPMQVGATMPDVMLQNMDEETIMTKDLVNKPTVLVVYRGGWCPYCNKQLSGLSLIEKELIDMGYQIVAISPDAPEQLKATMDKQKLSYQLFSDSKAYLIKAMGIAFAAPAQYGDMLLKASGGNNTGTVLPVPSVYILDKAGKVIYAYNNADYKVRLKEMELLEALKDLSNAKD